jgi:hypothetical protein
MPSDLKTLDEIELEPQTGTEPNEPELEPQTRTEPKTRDCLLCRKPFLSTWAGERVCRRCKSTSAWRSG